jgi:hypothetical protein
MWASNRNTESLVKRSAICRKVLSLMLRSTNGELTYAWDSEHGGEVPGISELNVWRNSELRAGLRHVRIFGSKWVDGGHSGHNWRVLSLEKSDHKPGIEIICITNCQWISWCTARWSEVAIDLILVLVRASPAKTNICHLVLYLLMGMRDGAVLRRCQPWSDADAGKCLSESAFAIGSDHSGRWLIVLWPSCGPLSLCRCSHAFDLFPIRAKCALRCIYLHDVRNTTRNENSLTNRMVTSCKYCQYINLPIWEEISAYRKNRVTVLENDDLKKDFTLAWRWASTHQCLLI